MPKISKTTSNTQEGNHQSDSQERHQGSYNSYGNNRPYQPRPYNNNRQGGYGNNRYSNNQGGYNRYNNNNNRYNNYQSRPMANPQLEGEPQSAAEGSVTNTVEGENAGGYRGPVHSINRYNQGGYNNNGNHYRGNNRQGGYNNNRPQGSYNNRQGWIRTVVTIRSYRIPDDAPANQTDGFPSRVLKSF